MSLSEADCEQIRSLVARYAFALDFDDAEAFVGCFTDDGVFQIVGLPEGHPLARAFEGHRALREFHAVFRAATQSRLRHLAVNVEIAGDGDAATARCYLLTVNAGAEATNGSTGIYRDELRKDDGRWRFAKRQITTDM